LVVHLYEFHIDLLKNKKLGMTTSTVLYKVGAINQTKYFFFTKQHDNFLYQVEIIKNIKITFYPPNIIQHNKSHSTIKFCWILLCLVLLYPMIFKSTTPPMYRTRVLYPMEVVYPTTTYSPLSLSLATNIKKIINWNEFNNTLLSLSYKLEKLEKHK
jgi:hypothetical protein